jgi:hypothetical protein
MATGMRSEKTECCQLSSTVARLRRYSSSQQQHNQHDQKDGAKSATDIRAAVVKAATTKQDQQDYDKYDQIQGGSPWIRIERARPSPRILREQHDA